MKRSLLSFMLLPVFLLSGCVEGTSHYLNEASNKNAASLSAANSSESGNPSLKCQNQTWCHNGWCSTHCEETAN